MLKLGALEAVRDEDVEVSRESHLAVRAPVREPEHCARGLDDVPHPRVESVRAAVEAVLPVVAVDLVDDAVEPKPRFSNAVRIPADGRAEVVARVPDVSGERVEPEADVRVVGEERLQGGAVRDDRSLGAARIAEREQVDGLPAGRLAEWAPADTSSHRYKSPSP